jgi:hypothetical protein
LNLVKKQAKTKNNRLLQVVQLASVALSDSLQLVDDTVRSILQQRTTVTEDE